MRQTRFQRPLRAAAVGLAAAALSVGGAPAQIGVQVNGTPVRFGGVGAMRMAGRVMIPLRSVGEALGVEMEWRPATRTVMGAKGARTFELTVGSTQARVAGRPVTLDVPATMQQGTVLVPLRFVAEALGADVRWRAADQQVLLATGDGVSPPAEAPGTLSGEVVSVDARANPPTVTVRAGGIRQTYPLARNAIVLRGPSGAPGLRADVSDLRPGDAAQLRVDEGRGTVTVVEAQYRDAAEPAAPATGGTALQIRSFAHNADGWLRDGSAVTLTLAGTPGSVATADIGSVARDVPLREDPDRPGRYTGRFTLPKGVTASDVPVIARLERGGQRAPLVQAGAPLRIDSQPPRISGIAPAAGTRTPNQRPNIYVNFDDQGGSGVDSASFRLSVRGRDVTADTKVTPSFAIYSPGTLPEGPVSVEMEIQDEAGNLVRETWSFTIAPGESLIRSVTHDAQGALRAGDVITVRMEGQPGGTASFDVGTVAQGNVMREQATGNYVGTYTVRQGDQNLKAEIVAYLRVGNQRESQRATVPAAVATEALTAPRITAPKAGEAIGNGLVVTGEAPPGSRVTVEIAYSGRALGVLPVQGSAGSQQIEADAQGRFSTRPFELQLPPGLSRTQLQVRARTVDPTGGQSDVTSVAVKLR